MKNSISDLIKEIFAEVNKEIIKILNFKNNEKKLKINEEKTLINNNSNNEKKDNNYIKEDDIINVTNFKEERIDYTEFKNEKTEIINNWKFELDKTIWNYYSELKIPILKGEIIELYNKICETADIELRKKKKSLIKEIIKVKKGNYYFSESYIMKNEINQVNVKSLKKFFINNRRYLGNKYSLTNFIKKIVEENCRNINIVADLFSGTGSVSEIFKDRQLLTNDLLYCNYISNYAWFSNEDYSEEKIINIVYKYNKIRTSENNYVRENFADTFFSADDCSKIGYIREDIEKKYKKKKINYKEYSILITILLYAMDRIANTVGHYDAYRKNTKFDKELYLGIMLPDKNLNKNNKCYNKDANELVKNIDCDLLYLDPPYNSRQYSDAYHLLENIASWEKPEVFGVARKMDRKAIKSSYCTIEATSKFKELIENTNAKYILLSYNNMSEKGDDRSNAKISDKDILEILGRKGKVTIFEEEYKMFSTGKSNVKDNKERLFLCEVEEEKMVSSPFNYTGGKYKLLEQLQKLFKEEDIFLDIFTGGGNVGINSKSSKIIFNDVNSKIISLIEYIKNTDIEELLEKINKVITDYKL